MGVARFKPRSYTSEPKSFGRAVTIEWKELTDPLEQDRQWAARFQHNCVVRIHQRLQELGMTSREYSELTGIGYDRITKVLRGDAVIRLEDVSQAERLLGGIVEGSPKRPDEPST